MNRVIATKVVRNKYNYTYKITYQAGDVVAVHTSPPCVDREQAKQRLADHVKFIEEDK